MPVARKVWQPILARVPSSAARRWIIRQGVDAVHGRGGERAGVADGGAEEGGPAAVTDTGRHDTRVEIGFQSVMRRHLMALAAFRMQPDPPALALRVIALDAHADDGTDAREAERHHGNRCRALNHLD